VRHDEEGSVQIARIRLPEAKFAFGSLVPLEFSELGGELDKKFNSALLSNFPINPE